MIYREIGVRIMRLRYKKGMTQKQLADKIGVSYVSVHKYEIGKAKIPIDKLKAIADCYNVDLKDLV